MEQSKVSRVKSKSSSQLIVADVVEETTVDGCGLRTSIYVAGCPIRCPHCHNKRLWDIKSGTPCSVSDLVDRVLQDEFLSGVSILGGEPFAQVDGLYELLKALKSKRVNTWVYSGYTLEQLSTMPKAVKCLRYIDTLIDGPYKEELKDITLTFRGSSNQRIINNPYGEYKEHYNK